MGQHYRALLELALFLAHHLDPITFFDTVTCMSGFGNAAKASIVLPYKVT